MKDYISKPVRKAELYRALGGFLSNTKDTMPTESEADSDADSSIINFDAALETLGGDRVLFRQILEEMGKEIPELLGNLEQAFSASDAKAASRNAHTIKGNARVVQAKVTEHAAGIIEEFAKNNDLESAAKEMPRLRSAIDALFQARDEYLAKL